MGNDFDEPQNRSNHVFNHIKDLQRQAKERRKREEQAQKRFREIQKERLRQEKEAYKRYKDIEKENMRKRMEIMKEEARKKKEMLKENIRRQNEINLQNRNIDNLNQRRPRIQSAHQPMIFGNQRREGNNNAGGFLFNIFNNINNNNFNNNNNNNNYINNNNNINFNIFNNYNNNNNNNFNIFNNSNNILNNNNNNENEDKEDEDKEDDNKIINMLEEIELTQIIIDKAETKECPICLIEYSTSNKICYLPCFHFFHSQCIKNWCQKSKRCPLCNVDIKFE